MLFSAAAAPCYLPTSWTQEGPLSPHSCRSNGDKVVSHHGLDLHFLNDQGC